MPRIIDESDEKFDNLKDVFDDLDDEDNNRQQYEYYARRILDEISHSVRFKFEKGTRLVTVSPTEASTLLEILMLDDESKMVLYYNKVEEAEVGFSSDVGVVQVLVWRSRDYRASGMTSRVFFDYLVKHYEMVVTDYEHTEQGRDMWERLLLDAVESPNYSCGIFNKDTEEIINLESDIELAEAMNEFWGYNSEYEEYLAYVRLA